MCKTNPDLRRESDKVHDRIRRVKSYHPEYTQKELAMVCCCGVNAVERALKK